MTVVRLAIAGSQQKRLDKALLAAHEADMTVVRLATGGPPIAQEKGLTGDRPAALLCSYFYLRHFQKVRERYRFRDWALDSGAFSAYHSGEVIDLQAYTEKCRELLDTDPQLTEVFALDVIGDWRATMFNVEAMWAAGVPAIPTFHVGQPWHALTSMAQDYPKIALGGMVGRFRGGGRAEWIGQCFARVWPKLVHGFGVGTENGVFAAPFDSVDATSWESGPTKFGAWLAFGSGRLAVRGSTHNLRPEVEHYLDIERRAEVRWRKELKAVRDATDWPRRTTGEENSE